MRIAPAEIPANSKTGFGMQDRTSRVKKAVVVHQTADYACGGFEPAAQGARHPQRVLLSRRAAHHARHVGSRFGQRHACRAGHYHTRLEEGLRTSDDRGVTSNGWDRHKPGRGGEEVDQKDTGIAKALQAAAIKPAQKIRHDGDERRDGEDCNNQGDHGPTRNLLRGYPGRRVEDHPRSLRAGMRVRGNHVFCTASTIASELGARLARWVSISVPPATPRHGVANDPVSVRRRTTGS